MSQPSNLGHRTREPDWVSSCCAAAMTTAGGDGSHGSTCWAVCRACGEPCDPTMTSGQKDAPASTGKEGRDA